MELRIFETHTVSAEYFALLNDVDVRFVVDAKKIISGQLIFERLHI